MLEMEIIRFKQKSLKENVKEDKIYCSEFFETKANILKKVKYVVQIQPFQVKICLCLAFFMHMVALLFNCTDIVKTTLFYLIIFMSCIFCDES